LISSASTLETIVVEPSQALSDSDYNMLRTTAINDIRRLGVVGEWNMHYAPNPTSKEYCIIEVDLTILTDVHRINIRVG
jgi:carbamoyl-phosphate synthase/aspartate carbamoyltransferase